MVGRRLWLAVALVGCGPSAWGGVAHGAEVLVFAAASLTDAMQTIGAAFDARTGHRTTFNFAGSNVLAMQIRAGARADVFLAADEETMDGLAQRGLVREATRRSLLSNQLVVVVEAQREVAVRTPQDLAAAAIARVALAEPRSVPAGKYARTYLQRAGLWPALEDKLVPTESVRAALAAVESGNVDAAFVYRTDASISKRVRIACAVPLDAAPRISYPVAGLRDGRQVAAADAFLAFLRTPEAAAVFLRFGFIVLAA